MSAPTPNQNNGAGVLWWKQPRDLRGLSHLAFRVWHEISAAIQDRDYKRSEGKLTEADAKLHGTISLRDIQKRAESGSLSSIRAAVDACCDPKFKHHFIRYRPGTDFRLTKPEQWQGHTGVEYRFNFQYRVQAQSKQKDTSECIPEGNIHQNTPRKNQSAASAKHSDDREKDQSKEEDTGQCTGERYINGNAASTGPEKARGHGSCGQAKASAPGAGEPRAAPRR